VANPEKITKVQDLLDYVDSVLRDPFHENIRYWFRGHGNVEYQLQPVVYREGFVKPPLPDEEIEQKRLRREQQLNKEFRVRSASIVQQSRDAADLYFLQRHYGSPTRLLDWSTNALVALYFAVSNTSKQCDGEIFVLDAYLLTKEQRSREVNVDEHFGIASSGNEVFKKALEQITKWGKIEDFPRFTFPVVPDQLERRIILQRGCFTFHVPEKPTLHLKDFSKECMNKIVIDGSKKADIKRQLVKLGIDDFSIYGDLESLARTLQDIVH
jgi:FRG domain